MTQFPVSTSNEQSIHAALELSKNTGGAQLVRIVEPHRADHIEENVRSISPEVSHPLVTRIDVQRPTARHRSSGTAPP